MKFAPTVHGRHRVARCKRDNFASPGNQEGIVRHQQGGGTLGDDCRESTLEVGLGADIRHEELVTDVACGRFHIRRMVRGGVDVIGI